MEKAGVVQGPPDISGGKRISNAVVTLPAGTVLTNADGTTTTLAADTQIYLQRVVLADPETLASASVSGEVGHGHLAIKFEPSEQMLEKIYETLRKISEMLEMAIGSS